MHLHQLVEVAALIAGQAPVLMRATPRCSESGLEQYWVASKCRLDRWGRTLKQYSSRMQEPAVPRSLLWNAAQPLMEEILASEVLTRVWTAMGCGIDATLHTQDIGPIVRGVYIGHQEARNRVLSLMLQGQGFGVEAAVELNRLRQRIERWTDMLLGYVHTACEAKEFAFDAARVEEFADDVRHELVQPGGTLTWQVVLTSLRAAFARSLPSEPVNADLHDRICSSILACFDPELFDSTGVFKSLWLVRMSNMAKDTEGMIDMLLAEHQPPGRLLPQRRF